MPHVAVKWGASSLHWPCFTCVAGISKVTSTGLSLVPQWAMQHLQWSYPLKVGEMLTPPATQLLSQPAAARFPEQSPTAKSFSIKSPELQHKAAACPCKPSGGKCKEVTKAWPVPFLLEVPLPRVLRSGWVESSPF